jgi:hypothetical protein
VTYHRYIVTVDITVAVPNAPSEPGTPADDELSTSIAAAVQNAVKGKVKGKGKNREYTVETVKKA